MTKQNPTGDNTLHPIDGTPFSEGFLREGLERMAREESDADFVERMASRGGHDRFMKRSEEGRLIALARRSATSPVPSPQDARECSHEWETIPGGHECRLCGVARVLSPKPTAREEDAADISPAKMCDGELQARREIIGWNEIAGMWQCRAEKAEAALARRSATPPDASGEVTEAVDIDLYAASQPAADAWRDIASAPKDGTQVLLGTIGSTHRIIASYVKASGGWGAGFCRDGNRYNGFVFSYSHWRPLPAPPSANPTAPQSAVEIVERLRKQWQQKTHSADYDVWRDAMSKVEAADAILAALRLEAR